MWQPVHPFVQQELQAHQQVMQQDAQQQLSSAQAHQYFLQQAQSQPCQQQQIWVPSQQWWQLCSNYYQQYPQWYMYYYYQQQRQLQLQQQQQSPQQSTEHRLHHDQQHLKQQHPDRGTPMQAHSPHGPFNETYLNGSVSAFHAYFPQSWAHVQPPPTACTDQASDAPAGVASRQASDPSTAIPTSYEPQVASLSYQQHLGWLQEQQQQRQQFLWDNALQGASQSTCGQAYRLKSPVASPHDGIPEYQQAALMGVYGPSEQLHQYQQLSEQKQREWAQQMQQYDALWQAQVAQMHTSCSGHLSPQLHSMQPDERRGSSPMLRKSHSSYEGKNGENGSKRMHESHARRQGDPEYGFHPQDVATDHLEFQMKKNIFHANEEVRGGNNARDHPNWYTSVLGKRQRGETERAGLRGGIPNATQPTSTNHANQQKRAFGDLYHGLQGRPGRREQQVYPPKSALQEASGDDNLERLAAAAQDHSGEEEDGRGIVHDQEVASTTEDEAGADDKQPGACRYEQEAQSTTVKDTYAQDKDLIKYSKPRRLEQHTHEQQEAQEPDVTSAANIELELNADPHQLSQVERGKLAAWLAKAPSMLWGSVEKLQKQLDAVKEEAA